MPDFDAEIKFPYGSKTSAPCIPLGHNLIHRNCGKVDKLSCIKNGQAHVFLWKSKTWLVRRGLAHIVFHNLCEPGLSWLYFPLCIGMAHKGVKLLKNAAAIKISLTSSTLI
jgi:hypothetical protein